MQTEKKYSKKNIISAVTESFGVSEEDILRRTRLKNIVQARQVLAFCFRYLNKMSFPEIAEILGKRDHTTAIYSFKEVVKKMEESRSYNKMVNSILDYIKSFGQEEVVKKPTVADFNRELERELASERELMIGAIPQEVKENNPLHVKSLSISDRERAIMDRYRKGLTLQKISDEFNLTRERIRQIVLKVNMKEVGVKAKDGFEIDFNEYLKGEKLAHESAKNKSFGKCLDCASYIEKANGYTSIPNFARDIGLSVDRLTKSCPKVLEKIKKNILEKNNRWSRSYICCRGCGTTKIPHMRNGYCEKCIGVNSQKTRKLILKPDSICAICGIDRGSAIRKFGRDFYIVKDGRILCRECFLQFTGSKLSESRRRGRVNG